MAPSRLRSRPSSSAIQPAAASGPKPARVRLALLRSQAWSDRWRMRSGRCGTAASSSAVVGARRSASDSGCSPMRDTHPPVPAAAPAARSRSAAIDRTAPASCARRTDALARMWACASMKPGTTVASPASRTSAALKRHRRSLSRPTASTPSAASATASGRGVAPGPVHTRVADTITVSRSACVEWVIGGWNCGRTG